MLQMITHVLNVIFMKTMSVFNMIDNKQHQIDYTKSYRHVHMLIYITSTRHLNTKSILSESSVSLTLMT